MRIDEFIPGQIGAAFYYQAFGINKPASQACLLFGQALINHRRNDQTTGANSCFPRPQKQDF